MISEIGESDEDQSNEMETVSSNDKMEDIDLEEINNHSNMTSETNWMKYMNAIKSKIEIVMVKGREPINNTNNINAISQQLLTWALAHLNLDQLSNSIDDYGISSTVMLSSTIILREVPEKITPEVQRLKNNMGRLISS